MSGSGDLGGRSNPSGSSYGSSIITVCSILKKKQNKLTEQTQHQDVALINSCLQQSELSDKSLLDYISFMITGELFCSP